MSEFENIRLVGITKIVKNLPHYLKIYIFEEFFQSKTLCDAFLQELQSKECMRLEYVQLRKYFQTITKNPYAIEYLKSNCVEFNSSYQTHFIDKQKQFKLMCFEDSFMVHILMCLYH
jgi:hypothetical protein